MNAELTPTGAIIATGLELRITLWNQAARDIYGWTAALCFKNYRWEWFGKTILYL
jgi:PAS domain-containing protein